MCGPASFDAAARNVMPISKIAEDQYALSGLPKKGAAREQVAFPRGALSLAGRPKSGLVELASQLVVRGLPGVEIASQAQAAHDAGVLAGGLGRGELAEVALDLAVVRRE